MSLFSKIANVFRPKSEPRKDPKPKYIHYGQRPKPDAKRHQKHGPKKD